MQITPALFNPLELNPLGCILSVRFLWVGLTWYKQTNWIVVGLNNTRQWTLVFVRVTKPCEQYIKVGDILQKSGNLTVILNTRPMMGQPSSRYLLLSQEVFPERHVLLNYSVHVVRPHIHKCHPVKSADMHFRLRQEGKLPIRSILYRRQQKKLRFFFPYQLTVCAMIWPVENEAKSNIHLVHTKEANYKVWM